jgi:hypothetical protein
MDIVYIGKCRHESQEQKVSVWYISMYQPISNTGLEEKIICLSQGSNPGRPVCSQAIY